MLFDDKPKKTDGAENIEQLLVCPTSIFRRVIPNNSAPFRVKKRAFCFKSRYLSRFPL